MSKHVNNSRVCIYM